jgi:hypothetical protein
VGAAGARVRGRWYPAASLVVAGDDDVFLLDGEGQVLELGLVALEDGGVEAILGRRCKLGGWIRGRAG